MTHNRAFATELHNFISTRNSPSTLNIFDLIAYMVSDGDTVISKAVPVSVSTKTSIVGWLPPSSGNPFDLLDSLSGHPCCDISHSRHTQTICTTSHSTEMFGKKFKIMRSREHGHTMTE
ncbi:hypothetical protein O3G_MSEX000912 [Manduca sexta]|nr:hypothetical protein O3G_MSEX000912 [Manduca sexta]